MTFPESRLPVPANRPGFAIGDDPARSLERTGFTALVSLLLGPIIAQGLWRPLVHVFGPSGSSGLVTGAALAISATIVLVQRLQPGRSRLRSIVLGGLLAAGASVGSSLGVPGLLSLLGVAVSI